MRDSFQNSHNLLKLQARDCWLFWCFVVSHGLMRDSFQNSHNLLKLQASDCWLFWCFVVSHGLMRDSNPKSQIADWTRRDCAPSEVIRPRSCVSNLRFLISVLRWAFVQFPDSLSSLAVDSSSIFDAVA